MRYLEDIPIGEMTVVGAHLFTADAIAAFAAQFGPPLVVDADTQRPRASGWHVACVWMRLLIDHRRVEDAARRARGEPCAMLGPSPGFRDLSWPHPVHAGDTVTYCNEVVDRRGSLSRPRWGLLMSRNRGTNQNGETVLSFVSTAFVERRPTSD
jgi:acyl dehydratase